MTQKSMAFSKGLICGNGLFSQFDRSIYRILRRFRYACQIFIKVASSQNDKSSGMTRTHCESFLTDLPGQFDVLRGKFIKMIMRFQIL